MRLVAILLLCLATVCFGCSKENKKALYFITKAKVYAERSLGDWVEESRFKEKSYSLYKNIFITYKECLTYEDLIGMYNIGKNYEKDETFLENVNLECVKRKKLKTKGEDLIQIDKSKKKYTYTLERAREFRKISNSKQRRNKYFDKKCFEYYKKAYKIDKTVFSSHDLIVLGMLYKQYESNLEMRNKLFKEAGYKYDNSQD